MTRDEAIRKAVDQWFDKGCSVLSEHSSDISGDIGRLHDEVAEVCTVLDIPAPPIPSYYIPWVDR